MLRASFLGVAGVMEMVVGNYRRCCAMRGVPVEEGLAAKSAEGGMDVDAVTTELDDDEAMDDAGEGEEEWAGFDSAPSWIHVPTPPSSTKKGPQTKVAALVREKVRRVLEDATGLADRRARMCDEGDFLRLLVAFNGEGIHFA